MKHLLLALILTLAATAAFADNQGNAAGDNSGSTRQSNQHYSGSSSGGSWHR